MRQIYFWIIRLVPALVLLETLFFKFSAAPVSVYIFTKIGLEPYGRIGIGFLELIAGILILLTRFSLYGAVLALGLMGGAIYFHLTKLGIVVQDDAGGLFLLSCIVAIFCILIIIDQRKKIMRLLKK